MEEYKFLAKLHGAKFEEDNKITDKKTNSTVEIPQFGDPQKYANLSKEEREQLTKDMLSKHKIWAENSTLIQ